MNDDVELSRTPAEYMRKLEHTSGEWFVVGYCVYDNSGGCENPLEDSDCYGEIHHHPRSRYGRRDSDYYEACGLDSYGDRIVDEDKLQMTWRDQVFKDLTGKLSETLLDLLADESVGECSLRLQCKYAWDNLDYDESHIEIVEEHLNWDYDKAVRECYEEGDKDAVMLDLYEHGLCRWSVSGGGTQCRWDTSSGESVWVPNQCLREMLDDAERQGEDRRALAVRWAQQACEVYTDWSNGNIYGICVDVFCNGERVESDSCWGYIGSDSAEDGVEDMFTYWKNWVEKQPHQLELEISNG